MSEIGEPPSAQPESIAELPRRWARLSPQSPALRESGDVWTYAQLDRAIAESDEWLAACGVVAGDRVLIVNENCRALVALIFAVARRGAWFSAVNARLASGELDAIVGHADPKLVVFTSAASPDAAAHAARLAAQQPGPAMLAGVVALPRRHARPEPPAAKPSEAVAALIYTSGTTGIPKAVMLTHRNLLFIAATSSRLRAITSNDRVYGALPISHVFGLASMLLATIHGGACIELVARFSAADALPALAGPITVFQGVPVMYARLLEYMAAAGTAPLPANIRYISAGGSPLDPALKQRVEAAFGVRLHNGYGLTECAPTVSQTRLDDPKHDASTGPPIPGIAVELRAPRTGAAVPPGEVGEIWVRGPNVMLGYYRNPAATAEVLRDDGWLNTGDLAWIDETGSLHIAGRTRELIIRSGFNVYPPDVEAALARHPEVTQCAVVGRAVDGNEEVVAFVQLRPGGSTTVDDLAKHAALHLAPYKRPSEIVILETFPASATGKILKARLRALASGGAAIAPPSD